MKNIISIMALLALFFSSCNTDDRTKKAIDWVNSHPKPIVVTSSTHNGWTMNYRCLFRDSLGEVFYAGEVEGFKPDTIKIYR